MFAVYSSKYFSTKNSLQQLALENFQEFIPLVDVKTYSNLKSLRISFCYWQIFCHLRFGEVHNGVLLEVYRCALHGMVKLIILKWVRNLPLKFKLTWASFVCICDMPEHKVFWVGNNVFTCLLFSNHSWVPSYPRAGDDKPTTVLIGRALTNQPFAFSPGRNSTSPLDNSFHLCSY